MLHITSQRSQMVHSFSLEFYAQFWMQQDQCELWTQMMGIPPGIRLESAKTPCLYGALIMCHHSYDYEFPIVCVCVEGERLTNNLSEEGKHHLNAMEEFFYCCHSSHAKLNLVIFGIGFTSSFEEEVNYVVQINTWTVCAVCKYVHRKLQGLY